MRQKYGIFSYCTNVYKKNLLTHQKKLSQICLLVYIIIFNFAAIILINTDDMKRTVQILTLILLAGVMSFSTQAQQTFNINAEGMITKNASSLSAPQEYRNEAKSIRAFTINPALQRAGNVQIKDIVNLQLFEDKSYTAFINNISTDVNGNFTLSLKLSDYPMAYGMITTNKEGKSLVVVTIPELGHTFASRGSLYSNESYMLEIDKSQLPPHNDNDGVEYPKRIGIPAEENTMLVTRATCGPSSSLTGTNPATLDVLMVYTPAAAAWATSSEGGISNTIAGSIAQSQAVLTNQGNGDVINLVGSAQINYTEVTNDLMSTDLGRLADPYDGYMDEVHDLRKLYGADIVVLLESYTSTGGLGYILGSADGNYRYAFNVIRVQQTSSTTTSIHEIGHNLGMLHNVEDNHVGSALYPYAYGWHWTGTDGKTYGSVMSYIGQYEAPYYSNPSATYMGAPTGTSTANNAQVFRNTKHVVAYYSDLLPNLPDAPTNLTVTNPTEHGATFSWSPAANAVGYYFCILVTPTSYMYWPIASPTATSITISEPSRFQPCNTYTYWVEAVNACGDEVSSPDATFSTACAGGATTFTLTASAGSGGSISPSGTVTVNAGASQTFTASPSSGYTVDQWKVNNSVVQNGGNSYTVSNVQANATVNVTFKTTATTTPPTITTTTLASGTKGVAYSAPLVATGSTPITWSRQSGNLPTGLNLSSAGVIAGTPSTAGTYNFTVKASNSAGNDTKALSITINEPSSISLSTSSLSFNATGGTQSVTVTSNVSWSVSKGSASWLTVSPTSGSNNGSFSVTATANTGSSVRTAIVTVSGTGTSSQEISVTQEVGATFKLTSSAGTGGTISPSGIITINQGASQTFTAQPNSGYEVDQWKVNGNVVQNGGTSYTISNVQADATINVTFKAIAPTITTSSLASGTQGVAYSASLTATGATPITWSLQSGSLPTGLNLSSAGVITGTPSTAGTYNFTVKASNSAGSDTKSLSITIKEPPFLELSHSSITFNANSGSQSVTVTSNVNWTVTKSSATWLTISPTSGSNNGSFTITVTENGSSSRTATVVVSCVESGASNKAISVTQEAKVSVTGVSIDATSIPENIRVGDSFTIKWDITPSNATDQGVSFRSSNTNVATVNSDGKVYAQGIGDAVITVQTNDGNKTASVNISILPPVGLEDVNSAFKVWSFGNTLYIKASQSGTAKIYNITGKLLYDLTYDANEVSVTLPRGMYIIRTDEIVRKAVIK